MELKELLDTIRKEERQRCLDALLAADPKDCAKTFLLHSAPHELGWIVPGLKQALGL